MEALGARETMRAAGAGRPVVDPALQMPVAGDERRDSLGG